MLNRTVQIQSVLQNNDKSVLKRALDSIYNAVSVNKRSDSAVGRVTVCYGDASSDRLFAPDEISELKMLYEGGFDLNYTFFGDNTGFSKGHNIIADSCKSDYMIIMDPEAVVCPKVLEKLSRPLLFDTDNTVGMTEARQTPAEHPKQYDRKTLETGWATAVCTMLRTSDFSALNGFDSESFFSCGSDVDLSWRMRLLGKKILYIPDCPVFRPKNSATLNSDEYYYALSALLMAYKWCADSKLEQLIMGYRSSDDAAVLKALGTFERLSADKKLPEKIDKEHTVSDFSGEYYTGCRYAL